MTPARRLASSVLLAAGIFLVFAGVNSALGFSLASTVASVVAIAGLLYAGAVWGTTSRSQRDDVLVFDHNLELFNGGSLVARFAEAQRDEIRAGAIATLAGARTSLVVDGRTLVMTPLVSETGAILYGALVEIRHSSV